MICSDTLPPVQREGLHCVARVWSLVFHRAPQTRPKEAILYTFDVLWVKLVSPVIEEFFFLSITLALDVDLGVN